MKLSFQYYDIHLHVKFCIAGFAKIDSKISLLYSATWLLWAIAISIVIVIYFAGNQHIIHERTSGIGCQAMREDKDIMPDSPYNWVMIETDELKIADLLDFGIVNGRRIR